MREEHAQTPTDAQAQLERLVALMDIGLTEPVPLACKTSEAYASAVRRGAKNVQQVTEKAWDGTWNFPGEAFELEHQRVFGGVRTVAELTGEPARSEESGEGWDERPRSRFGRWALRVWLPLLDCETRDELQ